MIFVVDDVEQTGVSEFTVTLTDRDGSSNQIAISADMTDAAVLADLSVLICAMVARKLRRERQ